MSPAKYNGKAIIIREACDKQAGFKTKLHHFQLHLSQKNKECHLFWPYLISFCRSWIQTICFLFMDMWRFEVILSGKECTKTVIDYDVMHASLQCGTENCSIVIAACHMLHKQRVELSVGCHLDVAKDWTSRRDGKTFNISISHSTASLATLHAFSARNTLQYQSMPKA